MTYSDTSSSIIKSFITSVKLYVIIQNGICTIRIPIVGNPHNLHMYTRMGNLLSASKYWLQ